MLTDTYRPTDAPRFALFAVTASLGIFSLLRLSWTEAHLVLPAVRMQSAVAVSMFGVPAVPVEATLACSGADALALCIGAILAYPVAWRMRLAGAAAGAAIILALNTGRIGTLGLAAGATSWFTALHLYVWPTVLTLSIAGYVLLWMRYADRSHRVGASVRAGGGSWRATRIEPSWRFVGLMVAFTVLFAITSPLYLESELILSVSGLIASAAALALRAVGVEAHAAANMLSTPRGAYVVTQECISTPLIPIYLAALGAYAPTWRHLLIGGLVTVPLFIALGVVRLLLVGLPDVVSPIFFVHAFYQLLLGAVAVVLAALWRHGRRDAVGPALAGVAGGALAGYLVAPAYAPLMRYFHEAASPGDPQGALAFLPEFQVGLYTALAIAAFRPTDVKRLGAGLAVLLLSQVAGVLALQTIAEKWGLTLHVRDVRAWAVAAPVVIFVAVVTRRWARRILTPPAYHAFWAGVGRDFPDLGDAASTRYYAANEMRLFDEHFPPLNGLKILKTDLWDEAKNTRILAWASSRGARPYGVDISAPIALQARGAFGSGVAALRGAIGDVRSLPFSDNSFDAIYSMGTIEHFDETEHAIGEIARVLKCGGRAIVGVPNRNDPFLRPLLATGLQALGLYGYGYEKSYSRAALRRMLERAGLEVVAETAILFIPGWLRMLDLACHSWCRPLTAVTGALVRPFVWIDRHVPAVRRHGYLLATVVTKRANVSGKGLDRSASER